MKYKALFWVLLKPLGVFLVIDGISLLFMTHEDPLPGLWRLATGVYLLFGGRFIVNVAFPMRLRRCQDCGYDLIDGATGQCPGCGITVPAMAESSK